MSVVILGSDGMLGYAVTEYFKRKSYDIIPLTRSEFDVIKNNISELKPHIENSNIVINCIGIIKQIIEGIPILEVLEINCLFPKNLTKLCKSVNVPLIHVTTDCAYSGKKGKYSETDFFDADDLYGISKIAGETGECMTLRTSLIGPEKDQKRSLMEWAFSQRGKQVNGYTNHFWNGVTTLCFAEAAEKILNENLYQPGIFHLHSPDTVSKYDLLSMFSEIFDLHLVINKLETRPGCDRSLISNYDLSRKLVTKPIRSQLIELKQFFNL